MALEAQELLAEQGVDARVVSMPSWEIFDAQDQDYKDSVLPPAVEARVSVEAGITDRAGSATSASGAERRHQPLRGLRAGREGLAEARHRPRERRQHALELLGRSERVGEEPGTPAVEDTAPEEGHS